MSAHELRRRLADAPVPDREAAEERAWRVVSAAFDGSSGAADRRGRRRYLRPVLAMTLFVAVLTTALTPPGDAVGRWISDAVAPSGPPPEPGLTSLPAQGKLLVDSPQGPWVVQRDGSKRRLGRYAESAWSPNGLFVVATGGGQIAALEPNGEVRWALARAEPIARPIWSPDGFRIAYLSGGTLRVVAGDGTGDRQIAQADPEVGASWRPGMDHQLAYVDRQGRVAVVQTDAGRTLWRSQARVRPTQLLWAPDGGRLIAVAPKRVQVFDTGGSRLESLDLPAGIRAGVAALHPSGDELALARSHVATRRSEVVALPLGNDRQPARRLFAGSGSFDDLAWSPDGRWLLVSWPDADQWLYIRSSSVSKVESVTNIGRQFDPGGAGGPPFPQVKGWCCPVK